jgi:Tfp pilus assembly protein PilO
VRKSRRQIANRFFEATGIGLVALDLVVFFAVYRPLGQKVDEAARHHTELRQTVRNQQIRVDVLKKYEAALPQAGKGLEDFATKRAPARREGFSTAAHLIHKVADASGVKVSTLAYRLDKEQKDPLERLQLEINVQGPYAGLLKFSHALETANEFMLVREFTLTPGGENGALGLRLGADLYLTP